MAMLIIATTLYTVATHNINSLPMYTNMHYTPSTTHHTAFHNVTNKHKYVCVSGSKIGQDVGMVLKCCVIPI